MGHFGRGPITRAWLLLVFPACILNYLGQGALILGNPAHASSPFFLLVPSWGQLPMVFLAAVATVIASQAVISGAFSVTRQAAQLGYLPRLRIAHTSEEQIGQIYVPWINWALLAAVLALVFTFKTSTALAYAYGVAVTGTITITTLLYFYVVRYQWGKPLWLVPAGPPPLPPPDPAVPGRQHHQAPARGLAAGSHRHRRVHHPHHLAEGPGTRHPAAGTRRGTAARVRGQVARQEAAAAARARYRRLPQPRQGHRPAGDARERRAQPRASRACPHPGHRDGSRAARPAGRAAVRRRPRLQRRPDHSRHRPLRVHGHA